MKLLKDIRACTICKENLPYEPKPIVHFSKQSKIIIIGQAPGIKVHQSGKPWDDASGERLRFWLGVDSKDFYNTKKFGIVPMGFCYPGKGKSGDLPPRPECAETWMNLCLKSMPESKLILLIGQYSQNYFLKEAKKKNLSQRVKDWKNYLPKYFVLPHPSPRNNIWLKKNPWFEKKLVPELQKVVQKHLS